MTRSRRPFAAANGGSIGELMPTDFLFVTDRPPLDVSPTGFTARYSAIIDEMSEAGTTSLLVAPKPSTLNAAGIGIAELHRLLEHRFGSKLAAVCVLGPDRRSTPLVKAWSQAESWYLRRDPWTPIRAMPSVTGHPGCVVLAHASLAHLGYERGGKRTVFLLEEGLGRERVPAGGNIKMRTREAYARSCSARIYRAVGRTGGLVVAISEDEARYFSRWIAKEDIVAIPDGIDLEQFVGLHLARTGVTADRFIVGVVGNLGARRNVQPTVDLVRTWQAGVGGERLRNVQWRLVGASPSPDILELSGPNVAVVGYVADLAAEYAGLDAAVIPANDARGAKSTLLAAWASGVPSVVSAASAAVMPVVIGQNALMFKTAQDGLEALGTLRSDPDVRSRIADAGRETARRYDARALAKQLMSIIAARIG